VSKNKLVKQKSRKPLSSTVLLGFALSVVVIITIAISILGYRFGWWRHPEAFSIFEWATYAAIIALIASGYGAFKARLQGRHRGLLLGMTGIALSLPVITATVLFEYSAKVYPGINDISTDTQDPPSFWDVPNPMEYPGQVAADLQQAAYPDLSPLPLPVSPEQAFEQALIVITDKGWEVIAKVPNDGRIEAIDTSLLFGFKDEVVVRITPSNDGAIVDVRSRSRIGRIDRGANAKRIRDYLKSLKERVARLHKS